MNYIQELNAFRNYLYMNKLPAGAISVWHALMTINNQVGWKKKFNASTQMMEQLTGLTKNSINNARKKLVELGLIEYYPGKKRSIAASYEMISVAAIVAEIMNPSMNSQNHDEAQNMDQNQTQNQVQNEGDFRPKTASVLKQKEKQKMKQESSYSSHSENPFEIYSQNFGILKPAVRDLIIKWCKELGDEIVIFGMKYALNKGGISFSYVIPILTEWKTKELANVEEVQVYLDKKEKNKTISFQQREESENSNIFAELRSELV